MEVTEVALSTPTRLTERDGDNTSVITGCLLAPSIVPACCLEVKKWFSRWHMVYTCPVERSFASFGCSYAPDIIFTTNVLTSAIAEEVHFVVYKLILARFTIILVEH